MQNVQTDDLRLSGKHVPSLDGVHGVAILLVIWFHLVQMFPEFHAMLGPLVVRTATLGQTGVDLFFVLSGFLITGILLDTRQHPHYFRNFFARRTLRIFPLYFVALAILLQFDRQWVTELPARLEASQLWMWTYLSNIPPSYGPTSVRFVHFWSLAVEEQFYLVWPLVVWFAGHRYIRHVCLACVLLGPCCRWLFMELEFSPFYSVFCRVDALAAG